MSKVQTDNDERFYKAKVYLRLDSLPDKKDIMVLECFAGNGLLWEEVKKKTNKNIRILKIDIKKDRKGIYLKGSNEKFLNMDLSCYDIIDLDAYGIPYQQLKIIFNKKYNGIIHLTAIQTMMGGIPKGLLKDIGYTEKMIKKAPSLFNCNGFEKIKQYLALKGVKKIKGFSKDRKNYYTFLIK